MSSWAATAILYGIQSGQMIKIGVARDLSRRLEQFRLHNPHELKVVIRRPVFERYIFQVEKRAHQLLAPYACGREWFGAPLPVIRSALKTAIAEAEERDLALRLADSAARQKREQSTVEKSPGAAAN